MQINAAPNSSISLDGRQFVLKQFHFHAPSADLVGGGKSYPLEAHLLPADKDGNLAIVGECTRYRGPLLP
jgi:carbonic anhydrase